MCSIAEYIFRLRRRHQKIKDSVVSTGGVNLQVPLFQEASHCQGLEKSAIFQTTSTHRRQLWDPRNGDPSHRLRDAAVGRSQRHVEPVGTGADGLQIQCTMSPEGRNRDGGRLRDAVDA